MPGLLRASHAEVAFGERGEGVGVGSARLSAGTIAGAVAGSRNGAGLLLDQAHATPTGSGAAVNGTSTLVGTGATGIGDLLNEGTAGGEGAAVGNGACGTSGVVSKSGGVERGGEGEGAFASVNVTVTDETPEGLFAGRSKPTKEGGFHSIGEVTTEDCGGSACGGAGRLGGGGSVNCGGVARIGEGGGAAPSSVTTSAGDF